MSSEQLTTLDEYKIALGVYKDASGRGEIEEAMPRLHNALLDCVACDAFDTETRNETLIEKDCKRPMRELSKCLTKLFPPSSISVARRKQALIIAKEVYDDWGSQFGIGRLPEQAEEKLSKNLTELGAQRGAISINTIAILTEFEHLNKDFENFLQEVG
jgi:hypothetical protein